MSESQNAESAPDCLAVEAPAPQPEPAGAERALPRFVPGFARMLANVQEAWMQENGLEEAPPVALLTDGTDPSKFYVFCWPSPWLH